MTLLLECQKELAKTGMDSEYLWKFTIAMLSYLLDIYEDNLAASEITTIKLLIKEWVDD